MRYWGKERKDINASVEKGIVIKSKTSIGSASELKDAIAYLVRRHSPPQIVFWIVTRSELLGHSLVLHMKKKIDKKKRAGIKRKNKRERHIY